MCNSCLDPRDCPHRTGKRVGDHYECTYSGRPVWVNCATSFCGEPPICRFVPLDNSPEATARRLAWMSKKDRD